MTTLNLKINEKTKAGKAFLAMAEVFLTDTKAVEVFVTPNLETVKSMYEAEKRIKTTKTKNATELFSKLGI